MCGIMGVFNACGAAELAAAGLHHIGHRARDYAGMVTSDGTNMYRVAGPGAVRHVFTPEHLERLHGRHALAHIRYPTVSDDPGRENIQPIVVDGVALAHNGNLTNADELRGTLEAVSPLATSMDSECILRLFTTGQGSRVQRLESALSRVRGSYALVMLFRDMLIAARDPSGNRPLVFGNKGESWFVASETVALDAVGARVVRDVRPGELIAFRDQLPRSFTLNVPGSPTAPCVFEEVYFSHPASVWEGRSIADFRIRLGRELADTFLKRHDPAPQVDLITPVPDSSNFIGLGVAQILGSQKFLPALLRSHDAGRTFIAADQVLRDWLVQQKFTVAGALVKGKSVMVVDDSIVRLTTLPPLVRMLRRAGAREVHVCIACPPVRYPCTYGINTPSRDELAAANMTVDEMRESLRADTLTYMDMPGLQSVSGTRRCFACMTGEYPLPV